MTASARPETCFFERDPNHALARRAGIEAIGTLMLMFAAAGSAVVAANFGAPSAAALLMHALATSGALVGLIITFGAVSGGHFNPIISIGQWLSGERSTRCTIAYVICQVIGGLGGAILVSLVFPVPVGTAPLAGWSPVASEVIATAGLMIIVFGCSRAKLKEAGPFAVGAWLTGMILSMPSSYANPALAIGALIATGPIVISTNTAICFVFAQMLGGFVALMVVAAGYGGTAQERTQNGTLP